MRRNGCGNGTIRSLCMMKSGTRTLRSWTQRLKSLMVDDAGGPVGASLVPDVSWGIWTVAMGPSTHLVVS